MANYFNTNVTSSNIYKEKSRSKHVHTRKGFPEKKLKFNIKLEVHKHPTEIIRAAASVPSLRFDPQLVAALCDQKVGVVDRIEGH